MQICSAGLRIVWYRLSDYYQSPQNHIAPYHPHFICILMHCMKVTSLSYPLFAERFFLPLKTQHCKREHRGRMTWIFLSDKVHSVSFRPAIIIPFQFYNLGTVPHFVCVVLNLCVYVCGVHFVGVCVCLCFALFWEVCCIFFGPYYSSWSLTWAIPVLAQRTWQPGPCNVWQASPPPILGQEDPPRDSSGVLPLWYP